MDDTVAQFVALTGASPETAAFFLESTNNNIEAAVDSFFASGGQAGPPPSASNTADASAEAPPTTSTRPVIPRQAPAARNVRGFADITNDDEEDDDDDHNDYYVGGEKSGQVVKGAPPPGATPQGRIEELFDNARRRGATDGVADDLRGVPGYHGTSQGGFAAFGGRARTLADASGDTPAAAPTPTPVAAPAAQGPLAHVIVFYRNGVFTVDDGPARHIDDPANAPFLRSIQRGECPQELEPADRSVQVTVNLLRKDEDYAEPEKPRYTAFAGAGRKLTDDASAAPTSSTAGATTGARVEGPTWAGVDEERPATSLQLRLADGSRMVARFNLTHTIGDVRSFIAAARPDLPAAYKLSTAFPSKEMADDAETIESAGLANAVLIQKM